MRIAFIFDALLYGGIERVGISYLKFLEEDGHDVDVFILNTRDIEGIIEEIPSRFKVHKTYVNHLWTPSIFWYAAKRWWWGKYLLPIGYTLSYLFLRIYGLRFLKYGKYDVAISMAGHSNDLAINAYNIIRSEKKIAWLHGCLIEYMCISPSNQRLYSKIKNLVTLNSNGDNTCFNFHRYLKKDYNIKNIYNPCPVKERPIDESLVTQLRDNYGRFILMIGRMDSPKNPISVIKALEHIYSKYNVAYNMVFVGDGPKLKEYRDYACKTEIKDHIHFVGNESNPQNYYKAASLFAFASYSEGMPTVIIEAMMFGLPIVTSDTSVREILEDGKDGLISQIDDHGALGEDIHRCMSDQNTWEKYSALSLKRAEAFAPETIKQQFNDFMSNLW